MLSLPGIPGDANESNKIDFPASYSDTVLLVGAMRKSSTIKVKDWTTAQRLLKICRQYDFAFVGSSIASQLGPFVKEAPMRIFAIASQYDNVALARIALGSSPIVWKERNKQFYVDNTFKLSELGDCSVPYLLALTECLYGCGLMSERGETKSVIRNRPVSLGEAQSASMALRWESEVANFLPKVGLF